MDDGRRCTAMAKSTGQRCKRAAVPGGTVCVKHGGGAPRAQAAAARRVAAVAWERSFGEISPVSDPAEVIISEICWAAGHVEWLRQRVAETDPKRLLGGGGGLLAAYNDERDRVIRMASVALRAGVEERQVRLAEEQGRLVSDLICRIITGIGLDPAAPEVREVVHRELTLLAGAA